MTVRTDENEYNGLIQKYQTKNLTTKLICIKDIYIRLQGSPNWDENDHAAYRFLLSEMALPRNGPDRKINDDILKGIKFIHKEDPIIDFLNAITPELFRDYETHIRNLLTNKPKPLMQKIVNAAYLKLTQAYPRSNGRDIDKLKSFYQELIGEKSPLHTSANNISKILFGVGAALVAGILGRQYFKRHNQGGSQND
jgi:hypothetical protein